MTRKNLGLLAVAMTVALAVPAGAHNLNPPPTRVTALDAQVADGTLTVAGTATFGGQRLLTLGTDPVGDTPLGLPPESGLDLTGAQIGQLNANTGDLTFVLKLAGSPPVTGGLPEVGRYTWDFGIRFPGVEEPTLFQIDGKFTDVLRRQSTRFPSFVLRADCAPDPNASNLIVCADVAYLEAEMIASSSEIFVDIPRSLLEQETERPIGGATIEGASIFEGIVALPAAYFSAGGTGDQLILDEGEAGVYEIGRKLVRVGIAPVGVTPTLSEATLADNGSYSASIDVSGLEPGSYEVTAQACFAKNCETKKVLVTI
jgi:hypothetical protein